MPRIDTARGHVAKEAVVYFENGKGHVIIAPDPSHPCPFGYRRHVADSVQAIDKLSKKMSAQEHQRYEELLESDWKKFEVAIKEQRSRLFARLMAVDCSPVEADFIRGSIKRLDANLDRRYNTNTVSGAFEMEKKEAPIK